MRLRGKIDRNQPEIVRALRQFGATVESLADLGGGCPDLLVGFQGRNLLLEVKDGMNIPSKRRLTTEESDWHLRWLGNVRVVTSVDEALKALVKL